MLICWFDLIINEEVQVLWHHRCINSRGFPTSEPNKKQTNEWVMIGIDLFPVSTHQGLNTVRHLTWHALLKIFSFFIHILFYFVSFLKDSLKISSCSFLTTMTPHTPPPTTRKIKHQFTVVTLKCFISLIII